MISVVVGTRNKLKAEAVKEAFKKVFSDEVFSEVLIIELINIMRLADVTTLLV